MILGVWSRGLSIEFHAINGLVGWWKFDEDNGTVAYDSSGNGNDGNLTNGPTWTEENRWSIEL